MGKRIDVYERFEKKFSKNDTTGCWIWTGCIVQCAHHSKKWPYGHFSKDGRQMPAHRASYELYKGAIGENLDIDHLCRNTLCVNPAHLEAVTHSENIRRGYALKPLVTHCKNGHEYIQENTYFKKRPGGTITRECRTCRKIQLDKHYARKDLCL